MNDGIRGDVMELANIPSIKELTATDLTRFNENCCDVQSTDGEELDATSD
jgi:hypothetical protein